MLVVKRMLLPAAKLLAARGGCQRLRGLVEVVGRLAPQVVGSEHGVRGVRAGRGVRAVRAAGLRMRGVVQVVQGATATHPPLPDHTLPSSTCPQRGKYLK